MKFQETSLKDVYLIELEKRGDDRGFFARSFCVDEFEEMGLETRFLQQNVSRSILKSTLRGMHYQIGESAEVKYIRCQSGSILDVIIDIRKESPTFMNHEAFELSHKNTKSLYIPKGFAHGFITLEENTEVSYLVSSKYNGDKERGIRWNDPLFNISWPVTNPVLSEKDIKHKDFNIKINPLDKSYNEC